MSQFNERDFLLDLEDSIKIESPEDVWEFIDQAIDRECIYYYDCFDIVKALNVTDWSDNEFGEITSIQHLAWVSLYEYVSDNIVIPA
tara:strand:+ start:326 stop:586 length:261 start_codon:yes stop_codon:yes gene_type:complete